MLKNKSFLSAAILFAVLETPCLLPSISFGMDPKEEQPPVSLSASSRVSSNPSFDETTSRALDLFRAPGKSLEERQKALGMIPEELRKDPSFLRHLEGIIGNFIEGPDVPLEQCIGYVANFITYPNQETLRRASNFLFFHLMLPHLQISPDSRKGILRAIIKKNGYGDQVNRAGYIFLMDMGGQFKLSEEETFNICQDVLKRACSLQYLLPIERLTALILDFSNALSLQQRIKGAESILLSSTVTPFEDAADRKKAEKEFGDFRVGLLHELVLKFAASADLDLIGVRAPAIRIAIKQNTDARVTTRAYAILKDLSLGEMERLFREDDFLTFLKSRMPYSYGFSSRYDDSAIAIITSCLKNPAFSSDQRVAFFQALTEKWDLYPQPFIVSAVREVFNPLMKDPKLSYPHKRAVFDSFIKAHPSDELILEFSSEFLDLAKDHQPSEAEKFSILQTFFLGEGYSLYHPRSSDRYGRQSEKGQKMHSLHSRIACNMASVLSNSNGKFSSDHDQALRYVQVFLEGSRDFHPSSALKLELLPSLLEIGKKDSVPMARRINALSQALSPQGCYISENERESVDYDCYSRLSNEASEVLMSLVKSKPEKVGVKDRLEALKNLFAYSPVSFGLKLEAFNIFGELYRIPSVFLDSPEYLSDIASYGEKKTASHEEKETATKLLTFVFTHEEFSLRRLLAFMRTECKWGYYGQDRLLSGRASLSRAFTAALERKGPSEYVAFQPEDADREAYYLKQQFEDTLEILSGYVVSLQGSDQAVNQFLNVLEADGIKVETRVKLLDKFLYEERGKSDQKNRAAKSLLKLTDHIEPSADNQGDVYGHMLHLSRVLEHSSEGNTLQVVFSKLQEIALNTELARETRQRSAELIIGGPDEFDRDNSIAVLEEFARQDILGEGDRNLVTLGCTSYSKGFDLLLQIAGEPRIPSHRKRLNILRSIMEAGPTRGASEEQLDRARGSINKILFELSSSPAFSDIPLTQYPEMMELFLNDAYWGSQSPFLSARNKEVGKVSMKRYYDERLAQGEKTNVHLQERIAIADEILQGPAWALGTLSPEQRVRAEELKKLRPTQKGSQPGN